MQSSSPMHYKAADGSWEEIEYKLKGRAGKFTFPMQNPIFGFEKNTTSIMVGAQKILIEGNTVFKFVSQGDTSEKSVNSSRVNPILTSDNSLLYHGVSTAVDKAVSVYSGALKYDYVINAATALPQGFDKMIIEDVIEVPSGFSIVKNNNQVVIIDAKT
ncbi:MAG: hypothetical protein EOP49_34005 [Sphingobacteriales bacterium]|nr:MAG: hypothetical protein EOP49_34005 [Sphingobacteriales bacterium]